MAFRSILFATLLVIVTGRPQAPAPSPAAQTTANITQNLQPPASILKNEFVDNGNGDFRWDFETSDGIKSEQTGHTVNPLEGEVIKGSYSYKSPDGQLISVEYVADQQGGFQPKGSHLPTPPPNPFASAQNKTASATAGK